MSNLQNLPIKTPKFNQSKMSEQEDASSLHLGDEFTTAKCLSLNEVQYLLKKKEETAKETNKGLSDAFEKVYSYVNHFGKFENQETLKQVRTWLQKFNEKEEESKRLTEFQICSLLNLLPEDREGGVEELKTLIPSLVQVTGLNDFEIKSILEEIESFKKFI
jgi:DNA-directed RNA polymerase subunit F